MKTVTGTVISNKMLKTVVVEETRLVAHPTYHKRTRKNTKYHAHDELGGKVGDVVDGIISGVADFGAFIRFVNDPEVEGLIHISELDHKLVENPKEIVKVDESVKAMITDIKEGRVSLSLKALKPDPWKGLEEKFKEGQRVKGIPFKYNPFGAFVNVEGALVQGLIHVSEFGGVEEMKNVLELGRSYEFVIDVLKPEEKRLILKIKKVEKEKEKEEEKKKEEKII